MRRLARTMGFNEPWLHQSTDEVIEEGLAATARDNPHFAGVTLEKLKRYGHVSLNVPAVPFVGGVFPTKSGKAEFLKDGLGVPGRFRDATDGDGLTLVTGASHHFVSSSFASQEGLLKNAGQPSVEIHPEDADARGIKNGDRVRLSNERGECVLRAVVTDAVRPGVVVSPKGRWSKLSGTNNVNHLTTDALADFAGQASYHSSRVRVERAEAT
jgi:anaerobic selenocysteine-containing dehydrogenase